MLLQDKTRKRIKVVFGIFFVIIGATFVICDIAFSFNSMPYDIRHVTPAKYGLGVSGGAGLGIIFGSALIFVGIAFIRNKTTQPVSRDF